MAFRGFGLGLGRLAKRLYARAAAPATSGPPEPAAAAAVQDPAVPAEPRVPSLEMVMENSGGMDQAAFVRMGDEVLRHSLIPFGGLTPDQRVLDVGCGCGKIARPLAEYLSPAGEYHGIDIGADCIAWCRDAYRDLPNFHFHHADLFSTRYTPEGAASAATYRFPVEDGRFDVVFLGSVFTHMLPAEVENYLREIARALRPGGKVLATWFLLDAESRASVDAGRSAPAFPFLLPDGSGCRVTLQDIPEDAIAYEEDVMRAAYAQAGLDGLVVSPGRWGRGDIVPHWQDVVWAQKPG